MTVKTQFAGELKDIRAVAFVCRKCGASQSFNPATWNGVVPLACPNCPNAKNWPEISRESIDQFSLILSQIVKASEGLPFHITVTFDMPDD